MPVQPGRGITPSLPGGALRLDVNPSETSGAVTVQPGGLHVQGQYGAEARIVNTDTPITQTLGLASFAALTFQAATKDYSEFTTLQQCNATDGVLTAQTDGIYEVGVQAMFKLGNTIALMHQEISVYSDMGFAGLSLNPAVAFGTANGAYGAAWQRIAQRTVGQSVVCVQVAPNLPDAAGWPISCVTQWCVKAPPAGLGVGTTFPFSTPAPTRFRFGLRTELPISVLGANQYQTFAWLRWLGPVPV